MKAVVLGVGLCLFMGAASAHVQSEVESEKSKGLVLYNQQKREEALEKFLVAAEAGDATAQYYVGELLRLRNGTIVGDEAREWYERAAEQGSLYSMFRLVQANHCFLFENCHEDEWWRRLMKHARERAATGDTDAMMVLWKAREGQEWLQQAAEAGDGHAQHALASQFRPMAQFPLLTEMNRAVYERWLQASAESGHPPGMVEFAGVLAARGDHAAAFQWRMKAAEAGYVDGVWEYAEGLMDVDGKLGIVPDPVKSYALVSLLVEFDEEMEFYFSIQSPWNTLDSSLSASQREEAMRFREHWERTRPPLSYFIPVYGFN